MVLVPYKICKDVRWNIDKYEADYYYIKDCIRKCNNSVIYIDEIAAFYNFMNFQ